MTYPYPWPNDLIGDRTFDWKDLTTFRYFPPTTSNNGLNVQKVENGYIIDYNNTLHIATDMVQLTELIQKLLGENK